MDINKPKTKSGSLPAMVRTKIRPALMWIRRQYFCKIWKMTIGEGTRISMSARLDRTNPKGIRIGKKTAIVFDAVILTHDFVNAKIVNTVIGDYCLIGARAIILPGVTIGDHCIVAPASVVMKDIPPNSIVAGNPARVIESDIITGDHGYRIR